MEKQAFFHLCEVTSNMFLLKLRFCQTSYLFICETTFGVLHFSSYWAYFIVVRCDIQIYLFI